MTVERSMLDSLRSIIQEVSIADDLQAVLDVIVRRVRDTPCEGE